MDKVDARKRNLKMKIVHWVIETGGNLDDEFTDLKLKDELYFKKSDIDISSDFFDENNKLKDDIRRNIDEYIKNNKNNKSNEEEDELKELYIKLKDYFINNGNREEYETNIKKAIELINKLHWKYMPIYEEQFIVNNGYYPEDIENYYNHFHAIEDLYWYIFNKRKISWKSKEGDINLNKNLNLRIYTTRWGHYDDYDIKRTLDGWYIEGLPAGTGKCKKNGEGAFTNLLAHDSVCYPKEGLLYALEELWKQADTTEMSIEELQNKINDLSQWIKEVEVVTHKYQPEWCEYY